MRILTRHTNECYLKLHLNERQTTRILTIGTMEEHCCAKYSENIKYQQLLSKTDFYRVNWKEFRCTNTSLISVDLLFDLLFCRD